jgi:hypothetical protein
MIKRIIPFLLLLYFRGNCIEGINLKLGMNLNYLISKGSGNSFQQIDIPSPVEISLQQKIVKKLDIEYGIGYNSRSEYSEIEVTTIDPNDLSNTIRVLGKAGFEFQSNYINVFVLPTLDFNFVPLHLYFKVGPHLEYYLNTYTKDFNNNESTKIISNVEKMVISTSQRTGVYIALRKITVGIELMCLENITKVFVNSHDSFVNFNVNSLIGYQF